MAVQLFKDGGHIYVEPSKIQAHLARGYSLVDPRKPPKAHPPEIYPERLRGIEKLPAHEQEKLVLAEMGIVEIVHPKPTPPVIKAVKKKVSKKAVKRVAN